MPTITPNEAQRLLDAYDDASRELDRLLERHAHLSRLGKLTRGDDERLNAASARVVQARADVLRAMVSGRVPVA